MRLLYLAVVLALPMLAFDATNSPGQGCTFRSDPSEFLSAQSRVHRQVFDEARKFPGRRAQAGPKSSEPPVRRNFIDDEIFNRLDLLQVAPAGRSSDEDFFRRVHLDLTGRIPKPDDIRAFVSDAAPDKRDRVIDRLLYTPEFSDKWAVWFADLIQNTEVLSTSARAPRIEGRNALDWYLRDAMNNRKPIRTMVTELITGTGNNYAAENGPANYAVLASTAMGPAQDTYDAMAARTTAQFLGIGHYDCLLCHSGPRHLTGISVWGHRTSRDQAQRMAAHFARMRLTNGAPGSVRFEHPLYNSTAVADSAAGNYDLNTTAGNRPPRAPLGSERSFAPEYRDGSRPGAGETWRAFYASKLTADPMFARNFANRIWKRMFGLGLVEPLDALDPDRLDPQNPPPDPWTLQATHPELLEKLARYFVDNDTDLRSMVRLMAESSAYQLSSRYDGEWKLDYVPLFARHYPRRIDAEEIVDAIVTASGAFLRYTYPLNNNQTTPQGTPLRQSDPVDWAMQLPDTNEPRNNAAVRDLMRTFYRGNRDTAQRLQAGSILQQLSIMNSTFVLDRIRLNGNNSSPVLRNLAQIQDNSRLVEELFLTFLSRRPSESELSKALSHFGAAASRTEAIQDLAWACINKSDFLFSY